LIAKLKNLFFAVVLLFIVDYLCLSSFIRNHFKRISKGKECLTEPY
jgi:hypothetical protein